MVSTQSIKTFSYRILYFNFDFRIMDSESCRTSDAVVITYSSLLIVVSVAGDLSLYSYDPAIFLIPEMDGVRILTNNCLEMIQKVPACVNNIFAINSQEPSSWLFEAHKKFLVIDTFLFHVFYHFYIHDLYYICRKRAINPMNTCV